MHHLHCHTLCIATGLIGLTLGSGVVHADPSATAICMRNAIAQYNDSQAASLVCLDQLEADIQAAIEEGLPLSPTLIQSRTEQCESLAMTKEQRKAAQMACVALGP